MARTHAQDLFVHPNGALDIVAVDPGHVTLVDVVCYHASGGVPVPPVPSHDESRRGKRRYALQHKLAERNLTRFSMSNAHWQQTCGRVTSRQRDEHLTAKMGLQPAIDDLAHHSAMGPLGTCPCPTANYEPPADTTERYRPRRWAFDHYHSEQGSCERLW
jgi:hypothetical protein